MDGHLSAEGDTTVDFVSRIDPLLLLINLMFA